MPENFSRVKPFGLFNEDSAFSISWEKVVGLEIFSANFFNFFHFQGFQRQELFAHKGLQLNIHELMRKMLARRSLYLNVSLTYDVLNISLLRGRDVRNHQMKLSLNENSLEILK